jgi:hypothetical protein
LEFLAGGGIFDGGGLGGVGFPNVEAAVEMESPAVVPGEAGGGEVGFAAGVGVEVGEGAVGRGR